MKKVEILNELEKTINTSFFGCNWETTGSKQVSSEMLDENCKSIEDNATVVNVITYAKKNYKELKDTHKELFGAFNLESFIEFIVYEFGIYCDYPNYDGGNVTYILTINKKRF
jgi:hypothetical protein